MLKKTEQPWNPRYLAYAKAHGCSPESMLVFDEFTYPGGCMTGFILWIGERKAAFLKISPQSFYPTRLGGAEISDFCAWDDFLVGP